MEQWPCLKKNGMGIIKSIVNLFALASEKAVFQMKIDGIVNQEKPFLSLNGLSIVPM